MTKYAFILVGLTDAQRQALKEGVTQDYPWADASATNYGILTRKAGDYLKEGYTPIVLLYTRMGQESLNESTLQTLAIAGAVRRNLSTPVVEVTSPTCEQAVKDIRAYVKTLVEAEDRSKPHEPTEVDRVKDQQAREKLQLQARQSQELLGAQQRELSKKAREKEQQIHDRERPREIVR